jgi:Tetratricopeptide repeat.
MTAMAVMTCALCTAFVPQAIAASAEVERHYFTLAQKNNAALLAKAEARRELALVLTRELASRQEVRLASSFAKKTVPIDLTALVYAVYSFEPEVLFREEQSGAGIVIARQHSVQSLEKEQLITALANPEKLNLYALAVSREETLLASGAVLAAVWPYVSKGSSGETSTPDIAPFLGLQALDLYFSILPELDGIWENPEKVHAVMREAIIFDGNCALYPNALGETALLLGLGHEAWEAQNAALKLDPGFARAYHARGAAHLAMQLPALAVADFSEAIRLNPQNATYRLDRAAAWKLRDELEYMCADLYDACALGECRVYEWAVMEKICPVPVKSSDI